MAKRKIPVFLWCFGFIWVLAAGSVWAQPKVGDKIGNLKFSQPVNETDMQYLGLSKMAPFTLKDVKAKYVLVDVFSTTCPHCFAEAPQMNKLYGLVSQDPQLKDKVKFIGSGFQDNEFKLRFWKAQFQVPFPLIPDLEGQVFNALKLPGTPVHLIMDNDGKVHWVNIGAFEDAEAVFKEIKAALK
jgi:thiol-disulfide isomerase/thioredoxin|uniref:Redoxin domain-containing protein n=1 Tax=Desulfobacca acetoxidans TaxID=60893 RepID=A0A7C3Z0Q9_9BACT